MKTALIVLVALLGGCSLRDDPGFDPGDMGAGTRSYRDSVAAQSSGNEQWNRDFRQGQYRRDLDLHLSDPKQFPKPRPPGDL